MLLHAERAFPPHTTEKVTIRAPALPLPLGFAHPFRVKHKQQVCNTSPRQTDSLAPNFTSASDTTRIHFSPPSKEQEK